jgi:phosphate/sulfate permease
MPAVRRAKWKRRARACGAFGLFQPPREKTFLGSVARELERLTISRRRAALPSPAPARPHRDGSRSVSRTGFVLVLLTLGLAFANGANDVSKGIATLVAVAMSFGSVLGGFRVTETLARKVTRITHDDGLLANLTTSALVSLASLWALPVSTTHVSSGAIIGIGAESKESRLQWRTVREMLLAWVVTLPAAALVAALAFRLLA